MWLAEPAAQAATPTPLAAPGDQGLDGADRRQARQLPGVGAGQQEGEERDGEGGEAGEQHFGSRMGRRGVGGG